MGLQFDFDPFALNFTNVSLLFSFLFFLVTILKRAKTPKIKGKFPPGPPRLPIIGNMHQMVGLPHSALRDLAKKYGPLMYIKLGEVPSVVVSSAQMAKEVLITHDPVFAGRPGSLATRIIWYNHEDLAFCPYGDHWKQMRKICMMELLNGKSVRSFSFIRQDEISKLIAAVRSSLQVPIDVTDLLFVYTSSMTCRSAFGRECKDNETMIKHLKEAAALAGGFNIADVFPSLKIIAVLSGLKRKLVKIHKHMDAIMDDVIDQHKSNHAKGKKANAESGDEDLIDVLLRLKESGSLHTPISAQNLKGVIFDMFTAGTDTSSSATESAMSELMRHPEVLAKAQAEIREVCNGKTTIEDVDLQNMNYLKSVIKETLRLHPPIPFLPRTSRGNREVNGYMIPSNIQVMVNAWALGRDPEYWEDPDSFKPERFEEKPVDYMGSNFEYLPFGAGRRSCPGITFGLANVELPLAHLLFHFNWSLPNDMKPKDLDMEEIAGITVGRKNSLKLIATAYDPSHDN